MSDISSAKPEPPTEDLVDKTVVALATASGTAAIAVVQLAGPNASGILAEHVKPYHVGELGRIDLAGVYDTVGRQIDQVLVSCVSDRPAIYEITCHGSMRIVQRVIETFRQSGAELAPSTLLSGLTYRLDNPVARMAYQLLPKARTTLAARFLLHQAHHGLAELCRSIPARTARRADLENALAYWPAVKYLIDGLTVVIVGPANAGKSTLLNYLATHEQALVTDVPGTTRDYVQADLEIGGLPIRLIDTAGLGHTGDPLSHQARQKTVQACHAADLAIVLLDAAGTKPTAAQFAQVADLPAARALIDRNRAVIVLNKIDFTQRTCTLNEAIDLWPSCTKLEISALTGRNIKLLENAIWKTIGLADFDYRTPAPFTASQVDLIKRALS